MLVNCTVFRQGKKIADIRDDQIETYLDRPDTFLWLELKDVTQQELQRYKDIFKLHDLAIEDAVKGEQRPKIDEYGDDLFAVMQLLDESRKGHIEIRQVNIFAGVNYVLSSSPQDFEDVRNRNAHEPQMLAQGPGYLFYALIDAVVDRYFPLIEKLESESEDLEDGIFTKGAARSNIYGLYRLKRKVMALRHAVAPMLEAVGKLQSGRVPPLCTDLEPYFRDVYDHLNRITASIDSIRDTISTAIQVNLSMVTIDQSEVSKRLAAWAGIFAIATAFAGIWGMNFKHMPELEWLYGYPMALGIIALACIVLFWRFKKAGWL